MSEFPNAEPRKKLIVSFDDEPDDSPVAPPPRTPPAPPSAGALWSGHAAAPSRPQPAPSPPPPPRVTAPFPAAEPPRMAPPPSAAFTPPYSPPPPPPSPWGLPAPASRPQGQYSSWGKRVVAALVDGVLSIVVTFIVMALVGAGIFGASDGSDAAGVGALFGALLAYFVVSIIWSLLYAPVTMMRQGANNGQTLGKQVVGIRVARADGQPVTAGTALVRDVLMKSFVIWGLGSFLFYIPGILDSLWPLGDQRKQSWHDKAVDTVVVDT